MAFEFAYNNPKYADGRLRLVTNTADIKTERPSKRRRCNSDKPLPVSEKVYEELFVNTVILSKDSLYFRRIFDEECLKESSEKVIDISISEDEKESFVDMIKYLYTNKLGAGTVEKLLQVWHLSQRFLVESCSALCLQRMVSLPLSLESSCYFLDAASVVNQIEEFKDLTSRSIVFLANHFKVSLIMNGENTCRWKNFKDFEELSAPVLESLLASDDLPVVYEDSVYFAVQKWIKANCKGMQKEMGAWKRFGPLIRWPMIEMFRVNALRGKIECNALRDLLVEALVYRASTDEEKKAMESTASNNRFRRRVQHAVPLKFISVGSPVEHGVAFFSLSMKDWKCLQESRGSVYTERFTMAGCVFMWMAHMLIFRKRVSIALMALETPPSNFRAHVTLSIWSSRINDYVQRSKSSECVRNKAGTCFDCFGKDINDIITDSDFVSENATLFKTEVQVVEVE